jgi:hypothetical protein
MAQTEITMKPIETTFTKDRIRIVFADAATKTDATAWIDLQIPYTGDEGQRISAAHREALQYAREALSAEIQRLAALTGRNA